MVDLKLRVLIIIVVAVGLVMLFRIPGFINMDSSNKPQLSQMSEKECIEFIKSRGVVIPKDLDNENLGAFVKNIITEVEKDPERPFFISYTVTRNFVEDIRKVVNEYYEKNKAEDK